MVFLLLIIEYLTDTHDASNAEDTRDAPDAEGTHDAPTTLMPYQISNHPSTNPNQLERFASFVIAMKSPYTVAINVLVASVTHMSWPSLWWRTWKCIFLEG